MIILIEPHHWCICTVWAVNVIEHIVDMASVAAQQTRHLSLLQNKFEVLWVHNSSISSYVFAARFHAAKHLCTMVMELPYMPWHMTRIDIVTTLVTLKYE